MRQRLRFDLVERANRQKRLLGQLALVRRMQVKEMASTKAV